jgi:hypothetical protein
MPQARAAPKRILPAGSPQGNRLSMGAVSQPWPSEPRNEGIFLTVRRLRVGPPPESDLAGDSVAASDCASPAPAGEEHPQRHQGKHEDDRVNDRAASDRDREQVSLFLGVGVADHLGRLSLA